MRTNSGYILMLKLPIYKFNDKYWDFYGVYSAEQLNEKDIKDVNKDATLLLETGDYVNGERISVEMIDGKRIFKTCYGKEIPKEKINNFLTKEQYLHTCLSPSLHIINL